MRKAIVCVVLAALVTGLGVAPAFAGKKVHDSFQATAAPLPNYSSITGTEQRSCLAGQEGVNKVSHPFTATGRGVLTATVTGFQGDWDLFLTDSTGKELVGSAEDQIQGGAPATETVTLKLKNKQTVNIVPCNFAGEPMVTVTFDYK